MIELRKASHCAYKIRYHMVFCVKYRRKLLKDVNRIDYIKYICNELVLPNINFATLGNVF
jgi:putative transposase